MMNNLSHIVRNERKSDYNLSVLCFQWTYKDHWPRMLPNYGWGLSAPSLFLPYIFLSSLPSLYTGKLLLLSKRRTGSIHSYALELFLSIVHINMLCCLRSVSLQVSSRPSNQQTYSIENQNDNMANTNLRVRQISNHSNWQ